MSAKKQASNGNVPSPLADAVAYEEAIAVEARELRSDATELDAALFLALWPLLCRPVPEGFIVSTPAVKGKPYESTGIRSLQVCIDRMNNVLTPLWWSWDVEYHQDGRLARARVTVGTKDSPLLTRESWGGVNQGSTVGNIYKGSETNAAKRAFAAVGVGHEVYVGATDLDPDVSEDAAKAQEGGEHSAATKLTPERADKLEQLVRAAGLFDHLPAKLRSFGVKALTDLDESQGMLVYEWTNEVQPQLAAET